MSVESVALVLGASLFGLAFGSFANVVIWRLPRGESLVSPPSHCPRCGAPIRWYDNVPVLSWLLLRGRCRSCGEPISWRYPAVELASGVLWAAAALAWGASPRALFGIALFYLSLILAAIDLDHRRLPNALVAMLGGVGLLGVVVALVGVPACPLVGSAAGPWAATSALLGLLLGGGVPLSAALVYERLRGRAGLGMGDVKLLAAYGLYLGPFVLMALLVGSFAGAIVGVASKRGARDAAIPFGPFLALGAIVTALWGEPLLAAYLRLAGLS
ncbi:MAG: prepilin peptidase [Anaerosomatales bacterium]|nr:prepilin peptidase [Anaerosomatales bacterium]